jgi:hypothetical protein
MMRPAMMDPKAQGTTTTRTPLTRSNNQALRTELVFLPHLCYTLYKIITCIGVVAAVDLVVWPNGFRALRCTGLSKGTFQDWKTQTAGLRSLEFLNLDHLAIVDLMMGLSKRL